MRRVLVAALLAACGPRSPTQPPVNPSHHVAPVDGDRDGDEIADSRDACPDKAEDFDLHDDSDGCPDADDDHDGVPDEADICFDLPGDRDSHGCPATCHVVIVTDITDCFVSPFWHEGDPVKAIDDVVATIREFPEIREITLQTQQSLHEPLGRGHLRLDYIKSELVKRGVRADMIVFDDIPNVDDNRPTDLVYGIVTRQRFDEGKFRETFCAGNMGPVRRVARNKNYGCKGQP